MGRDRGPGVNYEKESKEERNNFVPALVGATLNCGLPTLINFGRFISSCSTRCEEEGGKETAGRGENCHTNYLGNDAQMRAPYLLLDGIP